MTISQVSKTFNISTRTLRYYEQIGVLASTKKEDYTYRIYDEYAVRRLQQIIVLRKLRIPLKQISTILQSDDVITLIDVFRENLNELENEVTALSTIKTVLQIFITRLSENVRINIKPDLLSDDTIVKIVDSLTLSKINFKEEKSMEELNKANESLGKLQDKDVRILYLPPATVASAHFIGEEPEHNCGEIMQKFVKESGLYKIKNDARTFGFNHPNPCEGKPYGYEVWVTIPDDMNVPSPLVKKTFEGGLYAAHKIILGDFHEWEWLCDWVKTNSKFDDNSLNDGGECMNGLLEEHLNHLYYMSLNWPEDAPSQLDLLFPIKPKQDLK